MLGTTYPNVLQVPVSLFALYAALRRRPLATALGVLGVTGLKLWWIRAIMARTGHDGSDGSAP